MNKKEFSGIGLQRVVPVLAFVGTFVYLIQ